MASESVAMAPSPAAIPLGASLLTSAGASPSSAPSADIDELAAALKTLSDSPASPRTRTWAQIRPGIKDLLRANLIHFDALSPAPGAHDANMALLTSSTSPASPAIEARLATWDSLLDQFENYPFTIQRLAQLLLAPRKTYNSIEAYMRAIDKVVTVTSCLS